MTPALNPVLLSQPILHSNALAIVTERYVIVHERKQNSHRVVHLEAIAGCKTVKAAHAPLLVMAVGFFLVGAAALCSKEGGGAGVPCALLGIAVLVLYSVSRRASVIFEMDLEPAQTAFGTVAEASKLIAAFKAAKLPRSEAKPAEQVLRGGPTEASTACLLNERTPFQAMADALTEQSSRSVNIKPLCWPSA